MNEKMRLLSSFIDTHLRLNAEEEEIFQNEIAKLDPKTRKKIMQLTTSWKEEGIQEGILIGKQEEALILILRQLKRLLGKVSVGAQKHIKKLSLSQLEDLSEALLDFSSSRDLLDWLDKAS